MFSAVKWEDAKDLTVWLGGPNRDEEVTGNRPHGCKQHSRKEPAGLHLVLHWGRGESLPPSPEGRFCFESYFSRKRPFGLKLGLLAI